MLPNDGCVEDDVDSLSTSCAQCTYVGIGGVLVISMSELSSSLLSTAFTASWRICSACRSRVLIPISATVCVASSFLSLRPSAVFAASQGSTRFSIRTLEMLLEPLLARSWLTHRAVVVDPVVENDLTWTKP